MKDEGRLRILAGRLIDPLRGFDGPAQIVIVGGRFVGYARECGAADGERVLDASMLTVAPALVDLHAHLREPGLEEKETIATGTRAAAAGGFGTVCAMADTDPSVDTGSDVSAILAAAQRASVTHLQTYGTVTRGRRGAELSELTEMAEAGVIGFSDDGRTISDARLMRSALEYSALLLKPVVAHCEDANLSAGATMHEGEVSALLGLRGQPAAAEEVLVARDIALARATGGRLHLAHLSTAGSVELVRRAKGDGLSVTAEATAHHLTLTHQLVARNEQGVAFDTATRLSPPLRTERDIQALAEGLVDGTIDAIATDHSPHSQVDKACEYDRAAAGASGFETAFALALRLVHGGRLSLPALIELMTMNPARVAGLQAGTLEAGRSADLVVFDPNDCWTVDVARFFSRGKSSPVEGVMLRGRVRATLVRGELVHGAVG